MSPLNLKNTLNQITLFLVFERYVWLIYARTWLDFVDLYNK